MELFKKFWKKRNVTKYLKPLSTANGSWEAHMGQLRVFK